MAPRKRMLVAKTCKECEREFFVDLLVTNACNRKFCSEPCKAIYWRRYRKAWCNRSIAAKRAAHASTKPKAMCRYCGKEFAIPYGKMKIYCSPHCRKKFGVHGYAGCLVPNHGAGPSQQTL